MVATARATAALPAGTRAERLAHLRELAGDLRPVTLAGERCLPVLPAIEALLPGGGLRRGSTLAVSGGGATALGHAVLAGPTRAGSWAAFLGGRRIGWSAAAEIGVALERVAVVEADDHQRATVLASLVDAFDLVVVGPGQRLDRSEVRRLEGRARERGAVLIALDHPGSVGVADGQRAPWPGADVHLRCGAGAWSGPGAGWGRLEARRTVVTVQGRRSFDRPRRVELWLPGPDGVQVVDEPSEGSADVVSFGRRRPG